MADLHLILSALLKVGSLHHMSNAHIVQGGMDSGCVHSRPWEASVNYWTSGRTGGVGLGQLSQQGQLRQAGILFTNFYIYLSDSKAVFSLFKNFVVLLWDVIKPHCNI